MNLKKLLLVSALLTIVAPNVGAAPNFVAYPGNPVIDAGAVGSWETNISHPYVVRNTDQFYLFYTGFDAATTGAIGFATSDDGLSWVKAGCNPILAGDSTGLDAAQATRPIVFYDDDSWVMYYAGIPAPGFPAHAYVMRASALDPCGPWTREEVALHSPGPTRRMGRCSSYPRHDHCCR